MCIRDRFHIYNDYYQKDDEHVIEPVAIKYLHSKACLCGHFGHNGYMIDQRYPSVFNSFRARHRYRVFSFLREPLKMRCSLYRHQIQNDINVTATLPESIMEFSNYYSRIIGVNEENYKNKLDQYFFIGIQEELQLSFDALAKLLKKPKLELPVINTTEKYVTNSVESLNDQQIQEFKKENLLDYQIYNYVQEKWKIR